jgi:AcrR family transcriptional regulator
VRLRGIIGGMDTSRELGAAPGYPRSVRSPRGEARRAELLAAVAEDLKANGLADFSLRRAARSAGTTHKVLLYHFNGAEDLLGQAIALLREGRIASALSAAAAHDTLAGRVRAMWPVLMEDATGLRVIDQAIGLAMYDPRRYAHLANDATALYRGPLMTLCPPGWTEDRKGEIVDLILATMRGFLMEWQTTRSAVRIDPGLAALSRALDREESAGT